MSSMMRAERQKERATAQRIAEHVANLGSRHKGTAIRAEETLIRYYGSRALEPLLTACDDPDPQVRFRAAWALGHTRDPRAFDTLLRLTQDPNGDVRYDAAIALGILGDPRAVEPLVALMQTPDPVSCVHSAAAMGLGRMGTPVVPRLTEVFAQADSDVRGMIVQTFGNFAHETGDERCIALLRYALTDPDPTNRANAEYWLHEIGGAGDRVVGDSGNG